MNFRSRYILCIESTSTPTPVISSDAALYYPGKHCSVKVVWVHVYVDLLFFSISFAQECLVSVILGKVTMFSHPKRHNRLICGYIPPLTCIAGKNTQNCWCPNLLYGSNVLPFTFVPLLCIYLFSWNHSTSVRSSYIQTHTTPETMLSYTRSSDWIYVNKCIGQSLYGGEQVTSGDRGVCSP